LSLAPAKVRVEIFREPAFFDDHFQKGWTLVYGVAEYSGDTVKLTVAAGESIARFRRSLEFEPTVHPYFIVRVTELSAGATWRVYVRRKSDLTLFYGPTQSTAGLFQISILDLLNTTVNLIGIVVENSEGKYATFEYVAITKYVLLVPVLDDLVEELTVTRPLLNNGIAGATLSIPNFAGAYNGLIKDHDVIIIWIARTEADLENPYYKAFGGRIEDPVNRGDEYGAFYIDLDCHGHAYELDIPPALLKASYSAVNGRTIIETALALCTYLAKHPSANFWFDNTGSSGSTDDRIDSTHDVVYDEEVPMTVIREILEKAKNPGAVQGFDVYETPAGCLIGHLRDSLDFKWTYNTLTPRTYQKSYDLHRVRNSIKQYGKRGKPYPPDESWSEATTGWTVLDGSLDTDTDRIIGTCSLKGTASGSSFMQFYRTFAQLNADPKTFKTNFSRLYFLLKLHAVTGGGMHVRLYAPDASNYFDYPLWRDRDYSADPGVLLWTPIELNLGPDYETVYESRGMWTKGGSPDWANIQGINFFFILGITNYALFDDLKFMDTFFSGETTDTASIAAYGIRCAKPAYDDALKTDVECLARAESIKAVLKDPVTVLSDVTVDGDYWMDPGVLTRVVVANDALDYYFRIVQATHVVRGTQWDAILTLSNEPQMVDYIFRLVQEAQKLLERRT